MATSFSHYNGYNYIQYKLVEDRWEYLRYPKILLGIIVYIVVIELIYAIYGVRMNTLRL